MAKGVPTATMDSRSANTVPSFSKNGDNLDIRNGTTVKGVALTLVSSRSSFLPILRVLTSAAVRETVAVAAPACAALRTGETAATRDPLPAIKEAIERKRQQKCQPSTTVQRAGNVAVLRIYLGCAGSDGGVAASLDLTTRSLSSALCRRSVKKKTFRQSVHRRSHRFEATFEISCDTQQKLRQTRYILAIYLVYTR